MGVEPSVEIIHLLSPNWNRLALPTVTCRYNVLTTYLTKIIRLCTSFAVNKIGGPFTFFKLDEKETSPISTYL